MIQALLGHTKLETTARYARVATGKIAGVVSPLDELGLTARSLIIKGKRRGKKESPAE